MKIPPPNINVSALGMIKNFGERAAFEARVTADRCEGRHDPEGRDTWLAIAAAIEVVQPPPTRPNQSDHCQATNPAPDMQS